MSSNEELVRLVRQGNREALPLLWEQVRRLAYKIADRYRELVEANGGLELEDLHQCAYLAMVEACNTYKEQEGVFSSWFGMYMRNACREALGLRGRERKEHYASTPLESPIAGESEDLTLMNTLADETLPEPAEALIADDLRRDIRQAVEELPQEQGTVIRQRYFQGDTFVTISKRLGVSGSRVGAIHGEALRRMRRNRRLREYDPGYYRHKGVTAFHSSFSSVVEDAVISKIERQERLIRDSEAYWAEVRAELNRQMIQWQAHSRRNDHR